MVSLLFIWVGFAFVFGAAVGSWLNVCIYRIPYEKSPLWPAQSHCGHCFQPIRWYDNIPLVSYWVLRGRCRTCKKPFSSRYFFVELLVAIAFPALFYLEIIENIHDIPRFANAVHDFRFSLFDVHNLPYLGFFLHHAIL